MEGRLLERAQELEALRARLDDVRRAGAGTLVVVAGEAGLGKTALVRRFAAAAAPGRVFWGVCDPLATPAPLGPVVEVAAQLEGRAAELLGEGAARAHEVGRALIDDLGREPGAVVVLEDLHWADEGTLDVLIHLGRRIERVPALVVCTYRDEGGVGEPHRLRAVLGLLATAPRVERLSLAPLSREAVRTLAEAAGRDGDAVYATTGGNPFFVSELLASAPGEVPGTVRDAVLARAAQLDGEAQALLELVSIVPAQAEGRLLDAVAGDHTGPLGRCLGHGMLERHDDQVSFRHELARLAVEQALRPERAAALHRRVLRALEQAGADPARLVHHAEGAGDAAALLRHALEAGEQAAALASHREAADQYRRALSVAGGEPPAERASLLARYAFECYLTDAHDDAAAAQRQAVELLSTLGDREAEGEALRRLSRFLWFGGHGDSAAEVAREAVAVLEELPPGVALARAYSGISQLHMLHHETDAAIEIGSRALALAQQHGAEDVVVHALANIGSAETFRGRGEEGRALLLESLRRAEELALDDDAGRAYANLVSPAVAARQLAIADRYLAEGIRFCDDRDLLSYGSYLRSLQARVHLDAGRWRAAAELAAEVLESPRLSPPARILATIVAALVAGRTGDGGRCEALLADAAAAADRIGELQRIGPVAAARAEAAWLRGDAAAVDAATAAATDLATELRQEWQLSELVVWRHRAGLPLPAAPLAAPVAAEVQGDPVRAADLWTDLGCPYDAAVALAGAGEEAPLRRALAELQRLGATPAARIVARRLRKRGIRDLPRGPYRAARSNPAGLTARELEVLSLLAQQLRNAEIAERLVLSPRTVDHHVSRILAKLGAGTRTEAVAAAQRLGLPEDR